MSKVRRYGTAALAYAWERVAGPLPAVKRAVAVPEFLRAATCNLRLARMLPLRPARYSTRSMPFMFEWSEHT